MQKSGFTEVRRGLWYPCCNYFIVIANSRIVYLQSCLTSTSALPPLDSPAYSLRGVEKFSKTLASLASSSVFLLAKSENNWPKRVSERGKSLCFYLPILKSIRIW
jgi:hypothetical protein